MGNGGQCNETKKDVVRLLCPLILLARSDMWAKGLFVTCDWPALLAEPVANWVIDWLLHGE